MAALYQAGTVAKAHTRTEKAAPKVDAQQTLFEQVSATLSEKKQWMHGEVVYLDRGYYLRETRGLIDLHAVLSTKRAGVAILDPLRGWVAYHDLEARVTRFETGMFVISR